MAFYDPSAYEFRVEAPPNDPPLDRPDSEVVTISPARWPIIGFGDQLHDSSTPSSAQLAFAPNFKLPGDAVLFANSMQPLAKPKRKNIPSARYGSIQTNIFLQMQHTEIPKEEDDPYLVPIPARIPPPDDFLFDPMDERYLQLFLEKGKLMIRPLGLFFPKACEKMFKTSMEYKRLRHAIVAISMHYKFRMSPQYHPPNPRLNHYLQTFSSTYQFQSSSPPIQEAEVFSIFLILILTLVRLSETSDIHSLRQHVTTLYSLLRAVQVQVTSGRRERLSPLLSYIWRQVMRINVTFALGVPHFPTTFPPPASHPGGRPAEGHGPIRQYLGCTSHEFEQWTLAQLELDDLGNRIFRLHLQARVIRSSHERDTSDDICLILNANQCILENEQWRQSSIIQVAENIEEIYRNAKGTICQSERSFLSYPSLSFRNPLYACLLLTHYALVISCSLIVDPSVGPRSQDRIHAAVEICRIYAALGGNHPVGSLTCLASVWWAGLVFDSKLYRNEAVWVRKQLADPAHRGLGMRYLTHLKAVWKKSDRSTWDVWVEFPKESEYSM